MGSGIVEIAARVGIDVTFVEPTQGLVDTGRARIEGSTAKAVERDKLTAADRDALLARVRG
jgi:3-hydroxybutyryl-CoA dehydrogenase